MRHKRTKGKHQNLSYSDPIKTIFVLRLEKFR